MAGDIQDDLLKAEMRAKDIRIAALEKANADLHSRLDELRRMFGPPAILNQSQSPLGASRRHHLDTRPGPPFSERETASNRLAEHMKAARRFAGLDKGEE